MFLFPSKYSLGCFSLALPSDRERVQPDDIYFRWFIWQRSESLTISAALSRYVTGFLLCSLLASQSEYPLSCSTMPSIHPAVNKVRSHEPGRIQSLTIRTQCVHSLTQQSKQELIMSLGCVSCFCVHSSGYHPCERCDDRPGKDTANIMRFIQGRNRLSLFSIHGQLSVVWEAGSSLIFSHW